MPRNLDEELKQALGEPVEPRSSPRHSAEGVPRGVGRRGAEPAPVTLTSRGFGSGQRKGSVGLLTALLLMGGGILALVLTSFKNAAVYAKHVDEVVGPEAAELAGRRLRVEGFLVHGSLERRDRPCEYRFKMERNGHQLMVRYPQCIVPDTFRDEPGVDVGVTVEGKLAAAGDFVATQVMAKCPSKYEQRGRAQGTPGAAMPAL